MVCKAAGTTCVTKGQECVFGGTGTYSWKENVETLVLEILEKSNGVGQ